MLPFNLWLIDININFTTPSQVQFGKEGEFSIYPVGIKLFISFL